MTITPATLQGRQHHAGFHASAQEAHQAYRQLKKRLHPFGMLEPGGQT